MNKSNFRKRVGIVYSTNPDFHYNHNEKTGEQETLAPGKQELHVMLDKKQRAGKKVTLVTGFNGRTKDLENLGRILKTRCGSGGTVKDGEILIQGDFTDKVLQILSSFGYRAKKSGG
jgi:translation initiation factor 1